MLKLCLQSVLYALIILYGTVFAHRVYGRVVKLVDTQRSERCGSNPVGVQISPCPQKYGPQHEVWSANSWVSLTQPRYRRYKPVFVREVLKRRRYSLPDGMLRVQDQLHVPCNQTEGWRTSRSQDL